MKKEEEYPAPDSEVKDRNIFECLVQDTPPWDGASRGSVQITVPLSTFTSTSLRLPRVMAAQLNDALTAYLEETK